MENQKKVTCALAAGISFLALVGCLSDAELVNAPKHKKTELADQVDRQASALVSVAETEADRAQALQSPSPAATKRLETRRMVAPVMHSGTQAELAYAPTFMHVPESKADMAFTMPQPDTENYQAQKANGVIRTADLSTSTFSIDVDTGAYANVRRFLQSGNLPPADAVRVEELLNYFSYDYAAPDSLDSPFSITTELSATPWNANTQLLHIGLKGYTVAEQERPRANLVFLIDVSGSMDSPDKLGLLKSSISMLSHQLTADDTVGIVVYAGASGVVLDPVAGNNFNEVSNALSRLSAGGSTNGQAGIELAYQLAIEHFVNDGINRVILATDGDFNVGISDVKKLKTLIKRKRKSGIALTTLGFGTGNYNDHLMEQLADVGNGAYAYIDTMSEARKVLVEELTATLLTIAKDVKIQVEFNPAVVSEYRLIGYVNRHLANEDFANDKVDAGEIGAGHTVTALYEIALHGDGGTRHSDSRYQDKLTKDKFSDEIADVRLRYKPADSDKSKLLNRIIRKSDSVTALNETSEEFRFSAAVAAFGQLLRDGQYIEDYDLNDTAKLASSAKGKDRFGYRSEFVKLIDLAESLQWQRQSTNANRRDDNRG
jgi:Ca-activated chloride channel family protein